MAKIIIMSSDLSDVATQRRARSISQRGHDVTIIAGRKGAMPDIDLPIVDLGEINQGNLIKRFRIFSKSLYNNKTLQHIMADSDLVLARNIDMLGAALYLKWRIRSDIKVGYEVLDIHSIFTGTHVKARVARLLERRAMKFIAVLYVSSLGFARDYFRTIQNYRGPIHLIENKLSFGLEENIERPVLDRPKKSRPIRLGLVGAIRCCPSFELLMAVAAARPHNVELVFHGQIHSHILPNAGERIAECANAIYKGEYSYPEGLAAAYRDCDVVWGQDLWQLDQNSRLLLPNRIYEAGWHGCPIIAVSNTQTALKIQETGQGWVIGAARCDALLELLDTLTPDVLAQRVTKILQLNEALFRETPDDVDMLLAAAGIES